MKAFALMIGLLLAPVAVEALCIPKGIQPANRNDVYTYVGSVIDSLGWIKQGFSGVRSKKATADFGELLHALKAAQGDYRCAADGLTGFGESSDTVIRESAAVLRETYALLVVVNQRAVDEIVGLLDQVSKGQMLSMGTVHERSANLGVMTDDAWKMLPLAVIGVTYSLRSTTATSPPAAFASHGRSGKRYCVR
jgi:hypothetical protein